MAELVDVKLHLNMEIDKEERYWEKRARVNWLKNRDRNTSFFQKFTSQRRRTNRICGLQRRDGSMATDYIENREIARDYFLDLLDSRGIDNLDHILSRVSCCINDNMNQSLTAIYTNEEIKKALKGMGPTKATGSDGFPAIFFQMYWSIIGKDTSTFCLDILNNGRSPVDINSTFLVLIPKTANPLNLKNFYPISLCTVIYKIIAKTVVN